MDILDRGNGHAESATADRLHANWVIPHEGSTSPATSDILGASYADGIIQVAHRLSSGERLSYTDTRDLLKMYFYRQITGIWFLDSQDEADFQAAVGLSDRDIEQIQKRDVSTKDYDTRDTVSALFPEGVKDYDDFDAYLQLFCAAVGRLSQDEAATVARDVCAQITDGCFPDYFDGYNILRALADSQHAEACLSEVVDFTLEHVDQYIYTGRSIRADQGSTVTDNVNDLLRSFDMLEGFLNHVPAKLAHLPEDERRKVIPVLVDVLGFPHLLNLVRSAIDSSQADTERAVLVKIGRYILGVDDEAPFHESLAKEYESLAFEGYAPYQRTHEFEIELLQELAGEGRLVELGSGEGRILNALAQEGRRDLVGIDFTESYVAKARAADTTGTVEYRQADWLHAGIEDESCQTVISLGRSLCHTTDESGLIQVMRAAARMLQPGGQLIFDLPDPQKGEYHKARMRHLAHVERLGVTLDYDSYTSPMDAVAYVVDSPNGKDFMNRFVPSPKIVAGVCRIVGLEVEEVGRKVISDAGSETVYYRAVKSLNPDQESLQPPTLDSIMTSLSMRFADGAQ